MVWCPSCNGRNCGRKTGDLFPGRIACYCSRCDYDYSIWGSETPNGNLPCIVHGI